ncbi:hypothetical protein [Kangiella spongicola]|uniref:Periplasmic protein n=1 Tax=Kangiella spongicola TaxID=796379 RepID=A0A318D6K6_9GAMM|nr:hypothetical protein [Kangiella spongicola]PXF62467.1 hypothetical protein DL796_08955 [Kangiella spongicola]
MINKRILALGALLTLSFGLNAASSIEDCSAISDNEKRLQCYDNFLQKKNNTQTEPTKPTVEETVKPTKPVEAQEPQPEPQAPKAKPADSFGQEQIKSSTKKEITEIQSRAIGKFKMWEKGLEVRLENGQVWEITDHRSAYHMVENPKISIEKGIFDSYLLGIEGLNKRFRVKRIK